MNNRFYALTHVNFDIESMIANATEENKAELLNHILWHIPEGARFKNSDRDALVEDITAALLGSNNDNNQSNDDQLVPDQDENNENEVTENEVIENEVIENEVTENEVTENEDLSEIDVEE